MGPNFSEMWLRKSVSGLPFVGDYPRCICLSNVDLTASAFSCNCRFHLGRSKPAKDVVCLVKQLLSRFDLKGVETPLKPLSRAVRIESI